MNWVSSLRQWCWWFFKPLTRGGEYVNSLSDTSVKHLQKFPKNLERLFSSGSGRIFGIRDPLTGYGIWLLPGKRDSPKFGYRFGIGKENNIRDSGGCRPWDKWGGGGGGVHPDPEIRGTPGLKKKLFGSSGLRDNSDDRSSRCGILVKKGRASGIRIPFSRP